MRMFAKIEVATAAKARCAQYRVIAFVIAVLVLGACSSSEQPAPAPNSLDGQTSASSADRTNQDQLDALWKSRMATAGDFAVGPGDTVEVSASGVQELQAHSARVTGAGNIALPLIGTVHVAGMTESEVAALIQKKLEKFMYEPQVELTVKSDNSRLVAVTGSVRSPGTFTLNGPGDTIHDLLERAGGATTNAAQQVLLTPGQNHRATQEHRSGDSTSPWALEGPLDTRADHPIQPASTSDQGAIGEQNSPADHSNVMVIPLTGTDAAKYLSLPVRPGDTLFLPEAGNATVVGWVYHPNIVPITKGMTVLEAVSACGGPLFAADMSSVKVIRRSGDGPVTVLHVNLKEVENSKTDDLAVRSNDVIDVSYSTLRVPGYAVYYALQGMVTFVPAAAITAGAL